MPRCVDGERSLLALTICPTPQALKEVHKLLSEPNVSLNIIFSFVLLSFFFPASFSLLSWHPLLTYHSMISIVAIWYLNFVSIILYILPPHWIKYTPSYTNPLWPQWSQPTPHTGLYIPLITRPFISWISCCSIILFYSVHSSVPNYSHSRGVSYFTIHIIVKYEVMGSLKEIVNTVKFENQG